MLLQLTHHGRTQNQLVGVETEEGRGGAGIAPGAHGEKRLHTAAKYPIKQRRETNHDCLCLELITECGSGGRTGELF